MNNGYGDKYEQKGNEENSPSGNHNDNIENGGKKYPATTQLPQ